MKPHFQKCITQWLLLYIATLSGNVICVQTCPPVLTTGIASFNNIYFPELQATVNAAAYGTTPVKAAISYYRIKAREAHSKTFFSKVITIQTVLSNDILDISPVPARRYTMIKWSSTNNSKLNVTLFDVAGRFVLCRQYPVKEGENELLLTNLEALPAGIYFIKASDGVTYRNGKLRIQP